MLANYGYKDGQGEFFITLDTDKCNGCGDCIKACPQNVFVTGEDPNDPLRDEPVAFVCDAQRKKLQYVCSLCKPMSGYRQENLPCIKSCPHGVISHCW